MTKRHTVVLDWDGTLVPSRWPEQPTEWMPGAVEAIRRFHNAGLHQVVFSARLSPYDPWTHEERDPALVESEVQYIRSMLDNAALPFVDIWLKRGKPSGSVYIDDKGERYHARPGSWKTLAEKVMLRLGAEEPVFPAFASAA